MEGYRPRQEQHAEQVKEDEGTWCHEKIDGRWQMVLVPKIGYFDEASHEERERRALNTEAMLRETAEQWKLNDPTVKHNEGFLRDHPRYHELFEKWAMRYLRMRGFGKDKYSGKIHEDEGCLYGGDGKLTSTRLVNAVANGREWVDENIEMELRVSEGFVDISHDDERIAELGIEPEDSGWWTSNEI